MLANERYRRISRFYWSDQMLREHETSAFCSLLDKASASACRLLEDRLVSHNLDTARSPEHHPKSRAQKAQGKEKRVESRYECSPARVQ